MALYLGLDSSTQSLSAIVLETAGPAGTSAEEAGETSVSSGPTIVFEDTIVFDDELPGYGTRNGVLPADDPTVAVSPPLMWVEALDRMFETLAGSGLDLSSLAAIAGSAQQHGSVYLNGGATVALGGLTPSRPLAEQLAPAGIFARPDAPIWMDSSTTEECAEITAALGGADRLAQATGSRAFERFTGPQIRKFFKIDPAAWAATEHIHMISSFLASLLIGGHAPLDPGDASGTNLMDLRARDWWPEALDATAPELATKLPPVVPSSSVVGELAPYWRERFGLPAARVVAWSGDNPCSLIGTGLVREGQMAISLGTSDTIFGLMREPRVDSTGTGHVFGAPTGDYMGLTCFLNGSLARERIRDEHGLDWEGFADALRATPPGNDGALMLPWFEPEITPFVSNAEVRRFDLDPTDGPPNVRAVVEAQMMALARHSRWMGIDVEVVHATGGAARNTEILRVMADVFQTEVRRFETGNSACLGAALRAQHADLAAAGYSVSWDDLVRGVAEPVAGSAVAPRPETAETYRRCARRAAKLECLALSGCSG